MNEGLEGNSDREQDRSPEQKTTDFALELADLGIDPEEAKQIAVSHVETGFKYLLQQHRSTAPRSSRSARKAAAAAS